MKKIIFSLLLCFLIAQSEANNCTLENVEAKITSAFTQAWQSNSTDLENLVSELEDHAKSNASREAGYWLAFAQFRLGIYQAMNDEEDKAEELIDNAIESLEKRSDKSSEDYALLSMLTGFSIQFSPMSAMFKGADAKKFAKKAIALNDKNPRAHYALATSDFYTPKMFGGGDLVEKHLKKALEQEMKSDDSDTAPSWGKNEMYEMLVRFYKREDRVDDAKLYMKKALAEFPQDQQLNNLSGKL